MYTLQLTVWNIPIQLFRSHMPIFQVFMWWYKHFAV